MNNEYIIKSGIFGTVVGDALGVPVEFTSRVQRREDPVTDMREYGTHNQPKGTWSDDSSMMLATMDSMIQNVGVDYTDIMSKFGGWLMHGEYTPYGNVFDVGITCSSAVNRYRKGTDPLMCGGVGEHDNGNGSLMRIMPVSLYIALFSNYWKTGINKDAVEIIHNASVLTHRHPRSLIACMIYTSICHELIYKGERSLSDLVGTAITQVLDFYAENAEHKMLLGEEFFSELEKDAYVQLRDIESFKMLPDTEIYSSGYVVHTLEAAVWCLLNSKSYADCILKAVNLGDDTDTVGAVTGGLAGLWYGYDAIPVDWLGVIAKRDWIEELCDQFADVTSKPGMPMDKTNMKLAGLKKMVFEIGGFFGGSKRHSFFLEGDKLCFTREFSMLPNLMEKKEKCDADMTWETFIEALNAIHVETWKDSYEDLSILDGTQWDLTLEYDDSTKRVISGSNDYPDNYVDLILLLNRVTGGDFDSDLEEFIVFEDEDAPED
ncbi:ADP-ribosylglycohydrolase [Lachnospiraceae bacterium XBB2008]|nr:ADP-ribosylglycohydrolase [Lachnospiraceae bacterium XBB2008]